MMGLPQTDVDRLTVASTPACIDDRKGQDLTQADSSQPVPVAIIGMGCLFPMADDLDRFWSNIRGRLDAISEVPTTHWRPDDYWDDDPKSPDRTYARGAGFSHRLTSRSWTLVFRRMRSRRLTRPSFSAFWWHVRLSLTPATAPIAISTDSA